MNINKAKIKWERERERERENVFAQSNYPKERLSSYIKE